MWPHLLRDIEFFLNHSWHHTIRSTPYAVFFGRTELRNVGKVSAQNEYMEEDFLYLNDGEEDLVMDLQFQPPYPEIEIPKYDISADENLINVGKLQMIRDEQKCGVFESTEATIYRNRRAHVKRIRPHNFSTGDSVLFRNPANHGLASTLNIIGIVGEKVGRDLYKVIHDNQSIVLFGNEMVPYLPSPCKNSESIQSVNASPPLDQHLVLDKIGAYADLQRNFFAARRKYNPSMSMDDMRVIIEHIGYNIPMSENADLTSLFYIALDCGFIATLTDDEEWKTSLENNYSTLLHYLQSKRFQYFLSGIYWWDRFRSHTIPLIIYAVSSKTVPLFHYCSECLDEKPCTHQCCRLWLIHTCQQCVDASAVSQSVQEIAPPRSDSSGLMLLAKVASEKLLCDKHNSSNFPLNSFKFTAKVSHRKGKKVELYNLKHCSKEELASKDTGNI